MSCQDAQGLMNGYVDGELELTGTLEIERHMQDCQVCAMAYQNHRALRSAIGNGSFYYSAPANLQKRVTTAVRKANADRRRRAVLPWRWAVAAAAVALIAIVTWGAYSIVQRSSTDDLLAQEIVSGHVRSLMANHLTDVPSSDHHTVKPWFAGKLDFSPPVIELAENGFSLIGGRLDYIGNRPAAALVYQHRQHLINLFVWQSTDNSDSEIKALTRQGYNLIRWKKSGLVYWAVSDLNSGELQEFAQAVQSST
ncbi:MAG TPA: anti-sigma factor [Blastocatellia bacterium]|nr:anti-sigma factor [Blastocatellia bacterium]